MPSKKLNENRLRVELTDDESNMVRHLWPLGQRVIFRQHNPEETSPGGIILPDSAKSARLRGTVLRVGPDVPKSKADREERVAQGQLEVPAFLEPGDLIRFMAYMPMLMDTLIRDRDGLCAIICVANASDLTALGDVTVPNGWRVRPEN